MRAPLFVSKTNDLVLVRRLQERVEDGGEARRVVAELLVILALRVD